MKAVYQFGNKSLACGIYKAKEMMSPGDSDWKLCIRILVENMSLYEAYKLQARHRESEIGFELFQYFLEQCIRNNLMPKLFDLYLTEEDEDWVYQFLESKRSQVSQELLVIFCIKRHRYAEALKHGACFENQRWTYKDKSLFGGNPSRRAILHMSNEVILPMQRRLISCPSLQSERNIACGSEPSPLSSIIVKKPSFDDVPRMGTIFNVFSAISSTRPNPELMTFDEPCNLPFVRSANSPIGRKRRDYIKKQDCTSELPAKPEKKSILKPAVPEIVKGESPVKRRKHLFYGSEAMKLLQTPPVIRNPKHLKQARNIRTPASILKSSRAADKRDGTEKSIRKRVVISDPNFSVSPVQLRESPSKLPESPSKLPDSPSCLTPERQEKMLQNRSAVKENAEEAVKVLAAEGIKKSLHFEEKHENGEGSESSSPQKETVCITVDDEASCSIQPSSAATNLSSDSLLEKDVAIADTTGLKEAEIRVAHGSESVSSAGYQATQVQIQDKSEFVAGSLNSVEQSMVAPEGIEISTQDNVKKDQIYNAKDDSDNGRAISFSNDSINNSIVRFMESQDVTLDYHEEKHGVLVSEDPAGPSLAAEILASELATEKEVDHYENEGRPQLKDYPCTVQSENIDDAARAVAREPDDEFVLELDADSNDVADVVDEGMIPVVCSRKWDLPLLEVVDDNEQARLNSGIDAEKHRGKVEGKELENESEEEKGKDVGSRNEGDELFGRAGDSPTKRKEVGSNKEIMICEEVINEEEESELEQFVNQPEGEENKPATWEKNEELEQNYNEERNEKKEVELLSRLGGEFEFREELERETEMKADEDSALEAKSFGLARCGGHFEKGREGASSKADSSLSSNEKQPTGDSEMQFIIPAEPCISEGIDTMPIFGLDLRSSLKSYNVNTPVSELSTPNTYLGSADNNLSGHLSDFGTPDDVVFSSIGDAVSSSIGDISGIDLRSRRIPARTLQELSNKPKGNLTVIVGQTNVTNEMGCFDSSFDSQESSSLTRPLFMYNSPLVFDDLTQETGATPPKQAKTSRTKDIIKKAKANEKKTVSSLPTSVNKRSSYSPTKPKRHSFITPRKSPHDSLYTPPVTRSSAKKGTTPVATRSSAKSGTTPVVTRSSAKKVTTPVSRVSSRKSTSPFSRSAKNGTPTVRHLKEIEENAHLSSSISESPISFSPLTDSGKKRLRNRSRRYSFQGSSINSHSMTLRSRNRSKAHNLK